jgi:Zn-dependent protease with chaperone function
MSEIAFPLLGTAFVMLVVLPACALVAKAMLWMLESAEARGPLHGLRLRYLVLTGSSLLPLAWLLSAALHQAETGRSVVTCLFDHEAAALCFEPGLFTAALTALVVWASIRELRHARGVPLASSAAAAELEQRVMRIVSTRRELEPLMKRVDVTDEPHHAIGVQGLLAPRVVLGLAYAQGASDDELAGALGHEAEHVRARDPLRYLVLSLALAVNPFGRHWLQPHATSWLAAREVHCDREAVIRGAGPLALAQALIRAARPGSWPAAALGARSASLLKLRVEMLLAFEERAPTRCCHREPSSILIVAALFIAAATLPHHAGTAALDALHFGTEHALHFFWR